MGTKIVTFKIYLFINPINKAKIDANKSLL